MKNANKQNQALLDKLKAAREKYRIQCKYGIGRYVEPKPYSQSIEERDDIDMYINEYVPLERITRSNAR